MLKTRIIPTLLYKDFGLVKGEREPLQRNGERVRDLRIDPHPEHRAKDGGRGLR